MLITGTSLSEFESIVRTVSDESYEGNLIIADSREFSDNRFRVRTRAASSFGAGARWGYRGRRGPYACWHTTRDVLTELFNDNPDARVQSALATYRGVNDFEDRFPDTYWHNAGSMFEPAYFGSLCACEWDA